MGASPDMAAALSASDRVLEARRCWLAQRIQERMLRELDRAMSPDKK
jgi:hypothetical protein